MGDAVRVEVDEAVTTLVAALPLGPALAEAGFTGVRFEVAPFRSGGLNTL
jgi:hypothetical protein